MIQPLRFLRLRLLAVTALAILLQAAALQAKETADPPKGQHVFSAGHSFHVFMPNILKELTQSAGIKDHVQVGTQSIGGSRVIQHWNLPDEKNTVKPALNSGKVDVLTLSPIYLPDDGIEKLVQLALEHNPNVHVTLQEFWLPYDVYQLDYQKKRPEQVDRNARKLEDIREAHGKYFADMDAHVKELNDKFGKQAVYVAPVGQAVVALREKIIKGEAYGLAQQNDLFSDPIGHATAPLQVLVAYVHFGQIYGRSPVGLPAPARFKSAEKYSDALNTLLQQLAWDAVTQHPLSGVKADAAK